MKKILTRATAAAVSAVLCLTAVNAALVPASAESAFIIADSCEDLFTWTNEGHGELYIDDKDFYEGNGCILADLPATEEGSLNPFPFAMMLNVEFENPIDITQYPYFECYMKNDIDITTRAGMQFNFCDNDVSGADGINVNYPADAKKAGWSQVIINTASYTPEQSGMDKTHISNIRVSWLLYTDDQTYYEVNWRFDGMIFFNEEFRAARESEQNRIGALIGDTKIPTAETIDEAEGTIQEIKKAIAAARETYPNFVLLNEKRYNRIIDAYNTLRLPERIAAAEKLISDIGEVTYQNYNEKLSAITDAEIARDEIGEAGTLSNAAVLSAARDAYDGFYAVDKLISDVNKYADTDAITYKNKAAIEALSATFDSFTDAQKTLVTEEAKNTLSAAVSKIYEIEHPYTLGKVNNDDDITAADALMALQFSVGKIELTDLQQKAADVDLTDGVSAADALLILQYAVGKISSFPRG